MRIRIRFLLVLIVLFFGCEPKIDKIKGHWHTIHNYPNGEDSYGTLDINDSISHINKYCIDGMIYYPLPIKFEGNIILPTSSMDYSSIISIKQDTLTIDNELMYVRYDLKECKKKDLFCNLEVSVDLESPTKKSLPFDALSSKSISFINIGKIKQQFESFYSLNKDSFLIAVNGGFIELNEIKRFINVEYDKIESGEPDEPDEVADSVTHKKLYIAINADSEAPKFLIDSVFNRISSALESEQILLTTFNKEKNRIEFERR